MTHYACQGPARPPRAQPLIALILLAVAVIAAFAASPARAQDAVFTPTRFSVEVSGEGPDVIFIPGLATSRGVWETAAQGVAANHRVHRLQVKGFGEPAGANASGPVLQPLVEELSRYIAENRLASPAIVGHSLGGLMALMLGADHPGLVGKLMIVDAFPWYGVIMSPSGAAGSPEALEPQARQLRDALVASHGAPQASGSSDASIASYVVDQGKLPLLREWTAGADARVVGQLVYEDLMTDMRSRLGEITAPLTMLYPWNERYPTRQQAEALYNAEYAAVPQAELVAIGPAAHFLMTDRPDAFQTELIRFLAE